jgi:hypothetical protein
MQITITDEQRRFIAANLCQPLMRTYGLLDRDIDGSGNPLDAEGRDELWRFVDELRDALLLFGMTAEELNGIWAKFGHDAVRL